MIVYKTQEEIELIRQSAQILGKAHAEVAKMIQPGVSTIALDKRAEEFIRDNKGKPSFKGYNSFPASLCISVNDAVVHGIPDKYELKEGDIISIDCGVFLNGFHSDSAYTYPIGEVSADIRKLLKVTKESLDIGIQHALAGSRVGDISYSIQKHVEKNGFSVIRELVGHGVGRSLHESPEVPNFGKRGRGAKLKEGLVIAIEPMVNLGKRNVVQSNDGWTIKTSDRSPSAHYEHTVAINNGKCDVLTTFEYIEEVFKI
ncbi:type I methionyl aminopeptidase [Microscilla marina]|uniref:Methionine aminopeptidase n=1 Tax=Microscilla marina ATCC 23134 TaxID=313606 RepID=A1ZGT5_MICM2|nr:type I methionyl aminopeptidase [Microscilla marina]EAY30204.1 methionine aminopeptidase, type I [Microscilla marina ATCC 23134]